MTAARECILNISYTVLYSMGTVMISVHTVVALETIQVLVVKVKNGFIYHRPVTFDSINKVFMTVIAAK